MRTRYINMRQGKEVETVDEFPYNTNEDKKYFREMLKEYRLSGPTSNYYGSQRCANNWKNR